MIEYTPVHLSLITVPLNKAQIKLLRFLKTAEQLPITLLGYPTLVWSWFCIDIEIPISIAIVTATAN